MSMNDPLAPYGSAAREAELQRRIRTAERQGLWTGGRRRSMSPSRRSDLLAAVATGARPWSETRGLWRSFSDLDDLLLAAEKAWLAALGEALGHVDLDAAAGREVATLQAYAATRSRLPGLAALLDEHSQHATIATGSRWERQMIARSAGVTDASIIVAQARAAANGLTPAANATPALAPEPFPSSVRVPGQRRPVLNRVVGVLQRTAH
jgi:hypothetical protein